MQSFVDCLCYICNCPFEDESISPSKKVESACDWTNIENQFGDKNYQMLHGDFRQRQYNHGDYGHKPPRPVHLDRSYSTRKTVNNNQTINYYNVEESVRLISDTVSLQHSILASDPVISVKETNAPSQKPLNTTIPVGLKGSRPIVRLDRLSLITKYAPEDGDSSKKTVDFDSVPTQPFRARLRTCSDPTKVDDQQLNSNVLSNSRRLSNGIPSLAFKDLTLTHVIGGGGFGQVWHAEWKGTPVAVKVLSNICQSALPEQVVSAFEEEVAILAQLRHPNICLFLGVCLDPPNRTIVTELVSRGSLWDVLRIPGLFQHQQLTMSSISPRAPSVLRTGAEFVQWPVWAMRKVLEGTCRGLIYMHGCDPPIIHRDLKSANLLLDESFNVKICDFGLAKLRDYTTVLTANVGTIQWMAPEVLIGNLYNESADIYSLGIVMWELLTGRCPYEGVPQMEVAISVAHRGQRPQQPAVCTIEQWNLINQCWATDPVARPTANQLLKELESAFIVL